MVKKTRVGVTSFTQTDLALNRGLRGDWPAIVARQALSKQIDDCFLPWSCQLIIHGCIPWHVTSGAVSKLAVPTQSYKYFLRDSAHFIGLEVNLLLI